MWQCLIDIGATPLSISMFGGDVKNGELVISSKLLGSLCQDVVRTLGRLKSTMVPLDACRHGVSSSYHGTMCCCASTNAKYGKCYVRRNGYAVLLVLWRDEERGARTRHWTAGRDASPVERFDADCAHSQLWWPSRRFVTTRQSQTLTFAPAATRQTTIR
jgi:hypothetical protein